MASDFTQQQSNEEQQRAQELSLQRTRPPANVPGYETRRFLGSGAYGEVWVAMDQNTGRQVAIKYYTHRGGVDWSLLSREVEKLVMLSADRYVVQLLDVGWDADPPHYVMEYIENGSLDEFIRQHGQITVAEAVEIFRDIAVGLAHAHDKGILHCDLKPANVLLDQDHKPRLADFGQSRLSHDQTPALGTLFYMAPEQARLDSVPDAQWDVYALGAVLYCMLTGAPPHRNDQAVSEIDSAPDLPARLERYTRLIIKAPAPLAHRKLAGVDRALADIIDRCLAIDPRERFANVQAVLSALRAREESRARRPLVLLGFVGPCVLLAIMGLFAWHGYRQAIRESDQAVTARTLESNSYAAKFAAEMAARELALYFRAVEEIAVDPVFQQRLYDVLHDEELEPILDDLGRADLASAEFDGLARRVQEHSARQPLQAYVLSLMTDAQRPSAASWFVTDAHGTHLATAFDRAPEKSPIGRNFAYRTYFHGGNVDLSSTWRPQGAQHVASTHLSAAFLSTATNTWKVAVSTPITIDGKFLGVMALTVDLGKFMKFMASDAQFAVLVDTRPGDNQGAILQHPFYAGSMRTKPLRVNLDEQLGEGSESYIDPVGEDAEGAAYRRTWIAAQAPVRLTRPNEGGAPREVDTGLVLIVQEDYEAAIRPIHDLGWRLAREALMAVAVFVAVVLALWYFVVKVFAQRQAVVRVRSPSSQSIPTPLQQLPTLSLPGRRQAKP